MAPKAIEIETRRLRLRQWRDADRAPFAAMNADAEVMEFFASLHGLSVPRRVLPFSPCVEVGWRLARPYWGQGYATEGARAALRVGFERLELAEIVSFTSVLNSRSRAVMERIGTTGPLITNQRGINHERSA